ncbi:glycoprotease [Campylobacter geochelonis]|uniref:glycoprotease n=1 Tax=Campylobacter geochelonis TaxID=1780362 RepID=UPI0009E24723
MSLASPVLIGIYENEILIKTLSSDEKSSEFIIEAIEEILQKYQISEIIYANGPGSFMGIKVAYVILKTLSIVKSCPMYAVSGFELNGNQPIRANKNLSFVLEKDFSISLKKVEPVNFELPKDLSNLNKFDDILPNYIIDAV